MRIDCAYPAEEPGAFGKIQVAAPSTGPVVADYGLPEGSDPTVVCESLGIRIVNNLGRQLDGMLSVVSGSGTRQATKVPPG